MRSLQNLAAFVLSSVIVASAHAQTNQVAKQGASESIITWSVSRGGQGPNYGLVFC